MIINFSVRNFRSIKEKITLSFEAINDNTLSEYFIIEPRQGLRILKMGIIYGANASGKTNILLALDFLRNLIIKPAELKSDTLNFASFKFDDKTTIETSAFELEFFHNDKKFMYSIEFNQNAILYEKLEASIVKKYLVFERTTDANEQLSKIKFGSKIKLSQAQKEVLTANTLWNNTVLGAFKKTNIHFPELRDVVDWFSNILNEIITPDFKLNNYLLNFIKSHKNLLPKLIQIAGYSDLSIENIEIEEEQVEIPTETQNLWKNLFNSKDAFDLAEKHSPIPLSFITEGNLPILITQHNVKNKAYRLLFIDESAGTQRYLGFAAMLIDALINKKILVIDELEASLHPDLIKHFLLSFIVNSNYAQLIATTHFRELLQEKDILRPDIIWFTERKQDQSTDLFSLSDFDSSVIRKTSSYYNAYKIGKLGAVPNLKSYYLDLEEN